MQGAHALEPADLGALLGASVDAAVGGVDVHEGHPVDSGQQWGGPGQAGEEVPVHRVELAVVPVRERAQEGAEGGRRSHPAEQSARRAVPEPVGVVDRVGPGAHRRDQRHHLRARMGTGAVVGAFDAQPVAGQSGQAGALGQADQRDQPRVRDQIRLVEHDGDGRDSVRGLHLRDALPIVRGGA